MAAATTIALLGTLASLLGRGISSRRQRKHAEKQQAQAEERIRKREREQRREALARAIGANQVYAPKPQPKAIGPYEPGAWETVGGLGELASILASQSMAKKQYGGTNADNK